MRRIAILFLAILLTTTLTFSAELPKEEEEKTTGVMAAETFSGLALRSIGPALTSGRISDIAVDPTDKKVWYIGVASGNVWKTTNAGTTFTPIFEDEGSYSIGALTIDPNDPLVIWVGTGENNSQRSVGFGDGVYKSVDGGRKWTKMGLENSEHIARIVVHPRDSNVVWVAAQGPLWSAGGDRGLYKTTDGGKNWKKVLDISPNTGVTDIAIDPRNPEVVYAAAYQRRRHVWTLINGGPESAIFKTRDGGVTWDKLTNGMPKEQIGRIGLAIAPTRPDTVYAIVEAANESGGFFRSTDAGASWEKRNDYVAGSPQYYQEIYVDPKNPDRVYSMDTFTMITEDGGKTFNRLGYKAKHVDEHAIWIDPDDTDHFLIGNDGGLYETWDRGETYHFKENLPVTQFYKIEVDESFPAYHVYGGTQDNFTLGGPARTLNTQGITNADWFVTVGGDGFQTRVDPTNPNIVYSQSQYGGLARFDRKSGEAIDIRPQAEPGGTPLRFHWDSPLILSPHSHTRLYFGGQMLFRSDDRGNSWRAVSGDLTRNLDRNKLKVMDRVWPVDAVAKNQSTSYFGNLVALAESPLVEGLLYAGTDDGLVQVTEDGGVNWRKVEKFPGIPEMTYVSNLRASLHDENTVYATFNNHKMGDFKPYVLESNDRGRTWKSIAGDLPSRGSTWALVEDHVDRNLLFVGTEFGAFFTLDRGKKWIELTGGMPTIAVRDLAIQRRENDLVLGTFGRGLYVLDDYSPLRRVTSSVLQAEAVLFPLEKKVWMYIPSTPLGLSGKSFRGESFYTAPNPPEGAVFTYYLKDELKSPRNQRMEREAKWVEEGKEVFYPSWDELREEARAEEPSILLTIRDESGNVIRRIQGPAKSGFHRVNWDLRYPTAEPTSLEPPPENMFGTPPMGPMVAPGTYRASLAKLVDGVVTPLGEQVSFDTVPLGLASLPAENREEVLAFQRKVAELQRVTLGAVGVVSETARRIDHLEKALIDTPGADPALRAELRAIELRLTDIREKLSGDPVVSRYQEPTLPGIISRVEYVVEGQWLTTAAPTSTHQQAYEIAVTEFKPVLEELRVLVERDLAALERRADEAGAPWTPGRLPVWNP